MMRTQIAYVQAKWHSNIVSKSLNGFRAALPDAGVASFEVPGAFEMPLIAKELAKTGKYDAVVCAAFVVDGGIYRHDFVAQTVVEALMNVGLETGVPVLSVSLTPHHFQETEFHTKTFEDHFVKKGPRPRRPPIRSCVCGVKYMRDNIPKPTSGSANSAHHWGRSALATLTIGWV